MMDAQDVINELSGKCRTAGNILRRDVLDWGVGGRFILADVGFFPKWLRGDKFLPIFKLTQHLDALKSMETGFWLREFLRFLMLHTPKSVDHSLQSDFQAFCEDYGHCHDCLQKQFPEIFDNGV